MAGFIIFMPATTPTIPIIPGIPEIPDSKAFLSQNFPSHPATVENRNPPPVYIPHTYSRRISGAPSRSPKSEVRNPSFPRLCTSPYILTPHQRQYLPAIPNPQSDHSPSPGKMAIKRSPLKRKLLHYELNYILT